jgi:amino acid transporter
MKHEGGGNEKRVDDDLETVEQDKNLKRTLGFWSLLATGVGSVIGSGWLLAANAGANAAGPAVLIAWVIGGALMLMIALVFAELGMVRPESGGLVRYPLYSNGRLAATIVGWVMWISYIGNPPTEAAAVLQYADSYIDGIFSGDKLTPFGLFLAVCLMALFVVVNYFGVQWFAKTNNVVTAFKIIVPTVTVVLLVASGFGHHRGAGGTGNFSSQGFAPMGWSAALSAIATAGMIFAYTGFRNIIELSGEASNPKRDIPRALVGTIGIAFVLYMLLQVAFLMAVPSGMLAKTGWTGIDFESPFAQLAKLLGFMWLYWLLIADSMVSPSGSGIVFTASNARNAYGLAKSRLLPRMFTDVNQRSGVPAKALLFNLAVGVLFIILLPSWQSLVEIMSVLAVFTFSIGAVSLHVFRNNGVGDDSTRLRGMNVIAPVAFVVSTLVILWEPWDILRKTIPVIVATLLYYVFVHVRHRFDRGELNGGIWLIVYLAVVYAVSYAGSFGGRGWLPGPWDSVVVGAISLALYLWGIRAGTAYLGAHQDIIDDIEHSHDAWGKEPAEV